MAFGVKEQGSAGYKAMKQDEIDSGGRGEREKVELERRAAGIFFRA